MSSNHLPGAPGGGGPFRGLEEALEAIHACSSLDDLGTSMHALANQLGYAAFTYAELPRLPLVGTGLPFHITRVRSDFYATYKDENFIRHDPVWIRSMKRPGLFTWEECPEFKRPDRRGPKTMARKIVEVAHDFGYTQGIVVPVHGMNGDGTFPLAMISLYWQGPLKDFRAPGELPLWFPVAARFFHDRIMKLRTSDSISAAPSPELTARERECLLLAGQGETYSDTAETLGIDGRTVEFHIQNARKKLNANNVTHAVAIAMRCGLIAL